MSDKAADNLKYGTKKYFKQSFKRYADIVEKGLRRGLDSLDQTDIDVMSRRYQELIESGADKTEADKQVKSIVKEYMINENIKRKGKDPYDEKPKLFKDI